jgi:hypothetical protein
MDEKQVGLLNWMYNFIYVEMKMNYGGKFIDSDIVKVQEAIERRFPEYKDEIIKPFV